jgi:hypothetical protein
MKAAELKGCNGQTIYRWIEANKLNTIKESKRLKIVLDKRFDECEAKGPDHKIKNLNETIDDLKKEQKWLKAKIKDLELSVEEINKKLNQYIKEETITIKPITKNGIKEDSPEDSPKEIKNVPDEKIEVSNLSIEEIKNTPDKKVEISNLSIEGFNIHQGKKGIFYGTKRIAKRQHKIYIGKNIEEAEGKIKKYKKKNNLNF